MCYRLIYVLRRLGSGSSDAVDEVPRCLDGRPLRPGTYAAQIKRSWPPTESGGAPEMAGSYYAELWPMDQHAPLAEERPLEFGPFSTRDEADSFLRGIGTEV